MRYPTGSTNQEFLEKWYSATTFGTPTDYGFHEGEDLNLKTGGNSDLGQPLYAVLPGKIVYFHNESHPTKNFGRHMVLECETPKGKRWFHYAHCQEITAQVREVKEGDQIGKLGNSGTTAAHQHFSCFKVDPATLPSGIDTVAKTSKQLSDWWEDPIALLASIPSTLPVTSEKMYTEAEWKLEREERNKNWKLFEAEVVRREEKEKEVRFVREDLEKVKEQHTKDLERMAVILDVRADMAQIIPAIETCIKFEDNAIELQKQLEKDRATYEINLRDAQKNLDEIRDSLEKQLEAAQRQIDQLKKDKPEQGPPEAQFSLLELIKQFFLKN